MTTFPLPVSQVRGAAPLRLRLSAQRGLQARRERRRHARRVRADERHTKAHAYFDMLDELRGCSARRSISSWPAPSRTASYPATSSAQSIRWYAAQRRRHPSEFQGMSGVYSMTCLPTSDCSQRLAPIVCGRRSFIVPFAEVRRVLRVCSAGQELAPPHVRLIAASGTCQFRLSRLAMTYTRGVELSVRGTARCISAGWPVANGEGDAERRSEADTASGRRR